MVKVFWDNVAKLELQVACNYIKKSSSQNAKKVGKEIKDYAKKIAKHPESHSLDKYKSNNDGTFRYFEMHRLRISYKVLSNGIYITRIRHTSRKESNY